MKKTAIIIGHDRLSPGAYSPHLKMSEYAYHQQLKPYLNCFSVFERPTGMGYKTGMEKLAQQINGKGFDLAVELHFNSFNTVANGCETVSYPGNAFTRGLGLEYCEIVTSEYGTNLRGAKEGEPNGRGWWFLALMDCPAIIVEPFFGDNSEALKFQDVAKYAGVLNNWLNI